MGDDGIGGVIGDILEGVGSELKKIGQTAAGQVTGGDDQKKQSPTSDDLTAMKQKDDKFSEQSAEEIKAKISAIYAEHARRRQQEGQVEKQQEQKAEEQNKELARGQKKQSADVVVAQTKANAEIKNYGAE
ncbi:hypothetical protein HYW40_01645 [Candidatus Curtissbacteria bacterium]|nr:hypothetical protein [Candidatus Curtissbacteria bacterium]